MVFGAVGLQGEFAAPLPLLEPETQMLAEHGVLVEWFSPV